jgi:hypothetical protein
MNAPDTPHWTLGSCFGASQTIPLQHELRSKSGRTCVINAQVRTTMSRRFFSQQMYPTHAIGPQTHVLGHFGLFHFWMNFSAKRAKLVQLMHKFVQQSRVGIFLNERIRCMPLDPKLMFWGVSQCFVTARTSLQNEPNLCY